MTEHVHCLACGRCLPARDIPRHVALAHASGALVSLARALRSVGLHRLAARVGYLAIMRSLKKHGVSP